MKIQNVKVVDSYDWDEFVTETYKRPYVFQQQMGCRDRGAFKISIPNEANDDCFPTEVPEEVNHPQMGVTFAAWLQRDPKEPLPCEKVVGGWQCLLWWERNFYPDIQTVANDLHKKGLIEAGDYLINIDW